LGTVLVQFCWGQKLIKMGIYLFGRTHQGCPKKGRNSLHSKKDGHFAEDGPPVKKIIKKNNLKINFKLFNAYKPFLLKKFLSANFRPQISVRKFPSANFCPQVSVRKFPSANIAPPMIIYQNRIIKVDI
jgi:hypothetical protein